MFPLIGLAAIAVGRDQAQRAARLLGMAEALSERYGTPLIPAVQGWHNQLVAIVDDQRGEEMTGRTWAEGRAMTLEQAIADAFEGALPSMM
ncbi:MAG: hypothetical protein M3R24_19185 [Chloroflexota bacterium]|nr:hypothetical protein [Chloroflexota bacterium]